MSGGDEPAEWTQYSRLGQLRYSIRNLTTEFGRTESLAFGALVNLLFAVLGLGLFAYARGVGGWFEPVGSVAGVGLAILSAVAIVRAVIHA